MQTLLEVVWFVLPHLTFSLSAERTTKFDKLNHSCSEHFFGNQFDCFTWQVCKFPKPDVLSSRWKMLSNMRMVSEFLWVQGICPSLQFAKQFVHKAFSNVLCLETVFTLLITWKQLQDAIVFSFLFCVTKEHLVVSCNKFPQLEVMICALKIPSRGWSAARIWRGYIDQGSLGLVGATWE